VLGTTWLMSTHATRGEKKTQKKTKKGGVVKEKKQILSLQREYKAL